MEPLRLWRRSSAEDAAAGGFFPASAPRRQYLGYPCQLDKEDLFLALFEERIATDVGEYPEIVAGTTMEEQARGTAEHWMSILRERPDYFPLLIEFWAYAIREPALRERLAARFAALRSASAHLVLEAAVQQDFPADADAGEFVGMLVYALGNGLALEKLTNPDAVPDATSDGAGRGAFDGSHGRGVLG
jgi:AcrR family transcriptional regulator